VDLPWSMCAMMQKFLVERWKFTVKIMVTRVGGTGGLGCALT
jgi:hypothetical protein